MCREGICQSDHGAAFRTGGWKRQAFDSLDQILGQRNGRLENHSTPCLRARKFAAVESEPSGCVDKLALAVDEVGDPKNATAQKDRHFAALASTQNLPLNRMREANIAGPVHPCSPFNRRA